MRREKTAGYAMTSLVVTTRSVLLKLRSAATAADADKYMDMVLKLVSDMEADLAGLKSGGEVTNEQ